MNETRDELILGEDDIHLDFRISLLRRKTDVGEELLLTTVVRVHNLLGRVYIETIRAFHHLVVRRTLMRLAAVLKTGVTSHGVRSAPDRV